MAGLSSRLKEELPNLKVAPYDGEYLDALKRIREEQNMPLVLMFLGASIGNYPAQEARGFLKQLGQSMKAGDKLLIGFDLKKNPKVILDAYNDSQGVTKGFNLNLLLRINRELDADFDLLSFEHYPTYDPISGEARSFLISTKKQTVHLRSIGEEIAFEQWELIHTEISKKYDLSEIESLAEASSFTIQEHFFDCKHYFTDSLWIKQ